MKKHISFIALSMLLSNLAWSQTTAHAVNGKGDAPIGHMSELTKEWQPNGILYGYTPQQEILKKRTEFTKKFDKGNGIVDVIFGGPFHYKDANGAWQDINLTINTQNHPVFKFINKENNFISRFAEFHTGGVEMEYHGKTLSFGLNPAVSADSWTPTANTGTPPVFLNENIITYKDVYQDVDLEYELTTEMMQHRMLFNNRNVFSGLTSQQYVEFEEIIQLPLNTVISDGNGIITTDRIVEGFILVSLDNDTLFTILPSRIWDSNFKEYVYNAFSNGSPDEIIEGETNISFLTGGRIKYSVKIPVAWLLAQNRAYPVTFDPPVGVGGNGLLTYTSSNFGYPYPWRTNNWQAVTQTIYLQQEILTQGNITSIGYRQGVNNGLQNSNATIKMLHTNSSSFSSASFLTSLTSALSSSTLNYTSGSGTPPNCTSPSPQWRTINLNTPFPYNNTQNLIIETRFQNTSATTDGGNCNGTAGSCCIGGGWYYYSRTGKTLFGVCDCSSSYPPSPTISSTGSPVLQLTFSTACTAPTTQASNITFSGVGTTSMTVNWSNGNGSRRVVKISTSNSFTAPSDGTDPSASTVYSTPGQVVYNGSGSSVTITGLSSGTTYWFRVYEANCTGSSSLYRTTTGTNNPNSQATTTSCTAPTTQASNITFSGVGTTSMTVNWSNGNGSRRVVKISTSNSFTAPANGTDPSASTAYSSPGQVVYNGTGSSVTVTGLSSGTTYWFRVYEANCTGSSSLYRTTTGTNNPNSQATTTSCTAPTTQASNITFSGVGTTSMTVDWSNGNGSRRVVKISTSNSFTAPSDGTDPSASTAYSSPGQVVYNGSGGSVTVTGLSSGTNYWFRVYEANCTGSSSLYRTTTGTNNPNSQVTTTSCTAPTTQASNITFSSVGTTSMTVNWTTGNGSRRVVKINTSNSFTAPSDGTDPSAITVYSTPGQVVYNGSGNSVTVTGLTSGNTYWFRVYEANCTGSSSLYRTTTGTNNPNSQATTSLPQTSFTNCSSVCGIEILTPKNYQNNIYPRYQSSSCTYSFGFNSETLSQYQQSYAQNIPLKPEFSWEPVYLASYYVIELADNNNQRISGYSGYVNSNSLSVACDSYEEALFRLNQNLNYSTNYKFQILAYTSSNSLIACSGINSFKTTSSFNGNSSTHGYPHGHYKNVICRENEHPSNGGDCPEWECKEYVKRFLREAKKINMSPGNTEHYLVQGAGAWSLGGTGNLTRTINGYFERNGIINNKPEYGIKFYSNNSVDKPQPDDIVFSSNSPTTGGHVSILRTVSGQYSRTQQNSTDGNSNKHEFGYTSVQNNGGTWSISLGSNYYVSGWGRLEVARNCYASSVKLEDYNATPVALNSKTPTFCWTSIPAATYKIRIYRLNGYCWDLITSSSSLSVNSYISSSSLSSGTYKIRIEATPSVGGVNYGKIESDYFYFQIPSGANTTASSVCASTNLLEAIGSYASNINVEVKDSTGWKWVGNTKSKGALIIDQGYWEYDYDSVRLLSSNYDTLVFGKNHFDKYGKAVVPLFQVDSSNRVRNFNIKTVNGEYIQTQPTVDLHFNGENVSNYYWLEYQTGADGEDLPIPNQTTVIFHPITLNGDVGTIPLDSGFNQIEFAAVGQVDTAYLSLKLHFYSLSELGDNAHQVTFNLPQNLTKANLYVGNEFVSTLETTSEQMYLLKIPLAIRISRYGYRDTVFVAEPDSSIFDINLTPIDYGSDTTNFYFDNTLPRFWKNTSIKKTGGNGQSICFKQYNYSGNGFTPCSRSFSFRNLTNDEIRLKAIIALDQPEFLNKDSVYLLAIGSDSLFFKSLIDSSGSFSYETDFQKLKIDTLLFNNTRPAKQEIIIMKRLAPLAIGNPAFNFNQDDSLIIPLSLLFADPDSIKNDMTFQIGNVPPELAVKIVGNYVIVKTDSCWSGSTSFTLNAQHDWLIKSNTIAVNVAPSANPLTATAHYVDVRCFGANNGGIDLLVSGGNPTYSFSWSNGYTTQGISNLGPGTYSVIVKDVMGCTATATKTIIEPAQISANTTTTDANCPDSGDGSVSLSVSGGSPGYTYSWSNGASSKDLTNVPAGYYSVLVSDANRCTATTSITVSGPPEFAGVVYTRNLSCFGTNDGTALLVLAGGNSQNYNYRWSNTATTRQIQNLPADTFYVTATDIRGCEYDTFAVVNQPDQLIDAVTASPAIIPSGDSSILTTTGCGNCNYQWSPSTGLDATNIQNPTARPIVSTTYTVTVTSGGCAETASVEVTITSELVITGMINTDRGDIVPSVTVNLTGDQSKSDITDGFGNYVFDVSANGDYKVKPFKNDDNPNDRGVTTLDIIFIQSHILARDSLDSPYKIIAADVNGSKTVTTLDNVLIRGLILHIDNTFPNGRLWTFVPSSYVFPDPYRPFPYPDTIAYDNLTTHQRDQDFMAIKLGDVNSSWRPFSKTGAIGDVIFKMNEYTAKPNDEIIIPVKVKDFADIIGYQFTLSWNPNVLSLLEVNNKALSGFYGEQRTSEGLLTTSWNDETLMAITLHDDETVFELKFKVIGTEGTYSEIKIGSEITEGEAYNENLDLLNITSASGKVKVGDASGFNYPIELCCELKVIPNPFSNSTSIIFNIPEDETVSIEIYDLLGKQIKKVKADYKAGEHFIVWTADDDAGKEVSKGLYHVRMIAGKYTEGIKVVLVK